MGNIRNKLKDLFYSHIENASKAISSYRGNLLDHRAPSYAHQAHINFDGDDYNGVIYFYEWSNIKSSPRVFWTMKGFEKFLTDSSIFIMGYERELIRNLPNAYVTCVKNSKELIIKGSYDKLSETINKNSESELPYNVQCTHPPIPKPITRPMTVYEPNNRWDEREEVANWFG